MSEIVAKMDWQWLYDFAKKQLIVGFNGSTDMFRGNSGNPKPLMTKNDSSKPNPHTYGVRHEKRHAYSHAWLPNIPAMG